MNDETYPICVACGTQYETTSGTEITRCKICDDPRQFVPATGQQWTTLADVRKEHKNKWHQDSVNKRISSVVTEPKFGIGQRAILLETPGGNVLWDLVSLLDDETKDYITSKGGLKAIVISHPHFYTTHAIWAKTFNCPVYVSVEDKEWLSRAGDHLYFLEDDYEQIVPGVTAIKAGGHFPGSLFLHWERELMIADTMMTVQSAHTPHPRPPGQTTFSFLWSIPNMIPLAPDDIVKIFYSLGPFEYEAAHGNIMGSDVRDENLKERTLDSMKIQLRKGGWHDHEMLRWTWKDAIA